MTLYRFDITAGIATITFDMPGKVNVMTDAFVADMEAVVARLKHEREALAGIVITSAKQTFFAGGDLSLMARAHPGEEAALTAHFERLKAPFRELEQLGLPVVAALNGSALGGGYELALACHHRIAIDAPRVVIALPEVNFGILPGAGGVVRLTRRLGLQHALDYLLTGRKVSAKEALAEGLVDDLAASHAELHAKARTFIVSHPEQLQPWDMEQITPCATAPSLPVRAMPEGLESRAAGIIAKLAADSLTLDFDIALRRETEALVELLVSPEAAELIARFFAARRV